MHIVVVAFLVLLSWPAIADAPICFPERTVLWKADLHDARARWFGAVRAGVIVRVLRDGLGEDGNWSEIEVSAPARVRAYVRTDALLVFTREKAALESGWTWLLPETPVQITGVEDGWVGIVSADPHEVGWRAPEAWLPCTALSGHPARIIYRDDCHGAYVDRLDPSRGATAMSLVGSPVLTSLDGSASYPIRRSDLVFQRGTPERRVLVEVISFKDQRGYLGWLEPAALERRTRAGGSGSMHLCCEAAVIFDAPGNPGRLLRDVQLTPFEDAELSISIPRTAEVRLIARDPPRARVRVFVQGEQGISTAIFEGWVPEDAVADEYGRSDSGVR